MKAPAGLLVAFCLFALAARAAAPAQPYATPRFTDPDREKKVRAVLPEIDRVFTAFAADRHTPGLVWGVVLDGRLVHTGATGFANLERKIPAAADTRFRIASMTKSFTAMAVLKLRNAGKLALDDPAEKYVPEFRAVAPLTTDAPRVTLRHLLTMMGGFPQDDPWGDRQLADSVEEFQAFLRGGVRASNAPGVAWEYSNFGYAVLGQVVSRAAGEPYQRYITREILVPLKMNDTRWEYSEVPAEKLALGYRWRGSDWSPEPMLHDGTYGAMGGLITTINDFAHYVNLHLAAWPARNDPDPGPVPRATLREMHKAATFAVNGDLKNLAGERDPQAFGYGFGLAWAMDTRRVVRVGHSGGLPGFGSHYQFLPEHGVGVMSFANLTYAGTHAANNKAILLLLDKAGLPARTLPAPALLETRRQQVVELITGWASKLADEILAENFFLDRTRDDWIKLAKDTLTKLGSGRTVGPIVAQNQLRGTFPITGDNGRVDVFFTLTPEAIPRVQELRLTFVAGNKTQN